jgi:hypothetical protein
MISLLKSRLFLKKERRILRLFFHHTKLPIMDFLQIENNNIQFNFNKKEPPFRSSFTP